MAKRVPHAKKQGGSLLSQVQGNIRKLQRDVVDRVRKQAALLGREQKQVVERLLHQAERMQTGLEKDARRLSREVEVRADRFLSSIEKRIQESLEALVSQLDLPSRDDLQELKRRVAHVEGQLRRQSRAQAVPPTPVAAPPATSELPTTPEPPTTPPAQVVPEADDGEPSA